MGTTPKSNIRVPAGGDAATVATYFQNMGADLDWTGANFATTTARDLANPTPATGDACRILGNPQVYVGGAWVYVALTLPVADASGGASPTTTVNTSSWTALAISQVDYPTTPVGITRTSTTQLTVTTAGRYSILILAAWPNNSTGARILGYCLNGATDPGTGFQVQTETPPARVFNQAYTNEITLAANDSVAAYAFQDSGTTLMIGQRKLLLRRVG